MNYHGEGMYQWDTWYCRKKGTDEIHAFYLQARRPGSSRTAVEETSLGHAVSTNLLDWTELPTVLPPEPLGELDDLQSWTGSTIEHNGKYYMFYTMRSSRDAYKIQRLGMAVSDDLMTWKKYEGNPIINPDPHWYNTEEHPAVHGLVCCRDLMVVRHDKRPGYFGVFATRTVTEEIQEGAVFAGAYTENFTDWEQTPPVFQSPENKYSIVEMPDLYQMGGQWILTWLEDNLYGNREVLGTFYNTCGTVYAVSDRLEGPFVEPKDNILLSSMGYNGFSCRTVDFKGKKYVLYSRGERISENEQKPVFGSLSAPKEVRIIDGKLCYCFADLLLEKETEHITYPDGLPERIDHHIYYENEGRWKKEGGCIVGNIRDSWCRYCFEPVVKNFVLSVSITPEDCIAAGVSIRQYTDHRNDMTALAIFLDVKRQVIAVASLPRFQIADMRPFACEYGKPNSLRVVNIGDFVEAYVDDVLVLQFVSYIGAAEGPAGLLLDRGTAKFHQVEISALDIDRHTD